ncbi:MAG: FHA domain-containing protein, partial [bacterium]
MEVIKLRLRDLRRPDQAPGLYDLNRSPVRVGRGPRCEIRLHTDEIADVQVILRREGDHWCLHPVGPAQGCRTATGWLLETLVLASGNTFEIGHVAFEFDPAPEVSHQATESLTLTPELHLGEIPSEVVKTPVNTIAEKPIEKPARVEPAAAFIKSAPVRPAESSDFLMPASASVNAARPILKKQVAATGTAEMLAGDVQNDLGQARRIRTDLKPVASRLADHATTELPERRAELLKLKLQNQSLLNEIATVAGSNSISHQISRNIKRNETAPPAQLNQILNQWSSEITSKTRATPIRHGISALSGTDISENALNLSPIPRLSRMFTARDLPADQIAFESPAQPAENAIEEPATHATAVISADTVEFQPELVTPSLVAQTTTEFPGQNSLVIDSAEILPESVYLSADYICNDTEDDTVDLPAESAFLGIADVADSLDSALKCNQAAEFEEWLASVEPIFESIPAAIDACHTTLPDEPESHESLPLGLISTEPEDGSVEMLIEPAPEAILTAESAELATDFPRLVAITQKTPEPVVAEESLLAEPLTKPTAVEPEEAADLETWPSVGDIMRWQAGREGTRNSGLTDYSTNDRTASDETLEPAQVLKFNPALSLLVAGFVGFATLGGTYLTYRTGVQDDLTQIAISAVIASARSERPPRLPSATLNKMAQDRSWWELPADQIWWRASLMKQRENAGLEVPRASEELASRASQISPILPT